MAKKRVRRSHRTSRRHVIKAIHVTKFTVVGNNLLLFIALSLVSLVLTRFLTNDFLVNLFAVMAMVFGFISVAFLITLLVLVAMKAVARKRRR